MKTTISRIHMGKRLQPLFTLALLLPFFFIYFSYNEWNPFMLGGPHFLNFYMLLLLIDYLIIFLLRAINNSFPKNSESGEYTIKVQEENMTSSNQYYPFSKLLALLVLVLGTARLFQGINNGKPVGFLLLLLFFHSIFFIGMKGFLKKIDER